MSSRPPLELSVNVRTANGATYQWAGNKNPDSRPQALSFRTKVGDGFSDASLTLARRIDKDYPDLELLNDVTIVGADGTVAYEGRVAAMPRTLDDRHSIGVTLAGHMAHAKDRKFSEIYIDRDLSAWTTGTASRRAALLTSGFGQINGGDQKTDPVNAEPVISTAVSGAWVGGYKPIAEAWYDAGSVARIGQITFNWAIESGVNPTDANWQWHVVASSSDTLSAGNEDTGNLLAAGPGSGNFVVNGDDKRFGVFQLYYSLAPAGADGAEFGIAWSKVAVYGRPLSNGVPATPGDIGEPYGFAASDVIKDIVRRWCPQLNTDGVQPTGYAIPHLVFKDRTFPYDAFLEVNKYHLWHLGVWDNKTLHFRPYNLRDYQWEIRTDEPGTTFSPQGPSTDDLFNGIVVTYKDVLTGTTVVVTPDTNPELADSDPDNVWNRHGIKHWDEIQLSSPTTNAQAVQIGRMALGDRNRPKAPGQVTVKGHIRDRAGNWQPVWKVRAGDTVAITTSPNDQPRLVVETSYDDSSKEVTLSLDRPFAMVDALLDRIGNALGARGLV